LRISPESCFGIAFCGATATLLSLFLQDDALLRPAAPLLVLLVVIPTAHFWGTPSAMIGATIASLTFAVLLFPPLGSLAVHDHKDQIILLSFQLGAIGVSYLSSPRSSRER
jgi:K+-sensing histidine kinase KdpD